MAQRPIFLPSFKNESLVEEVMLDLHWHSGFAPVQKKKNVEALHSAARQQGVWPILEVSTKSNEPVGVRLSAFNLKTPFESVLLPLEVAFQGSKVFAFDGPFVDLYDSDPRKAKRDDRLRKSGELREFRFGEVRFPLSPVTAFYDWLYLRALQPHREWLDKLAYYRGFSDIEFNPAKSVNCQARSCALFFSLEKRGLLDTALKSPSNFLQLLKKHNYMSSLPNLRSSSQYQLSW